jgi:hypothetical protein
MKKYTLAHVSILMSLFYLTSLVGDYIHYSPENIFTYFDFYRVRFNSILLPCIALSIVTIKLRENINFMSYTYVISFLLLLQVFIHQFVSNKFNFWNETILIHITVMSFCCLILFISIVLNRTPKKKNPKIQKIKNILTNLTLLTSVILGVYSFVVYQGPDELYLLGSSIIVSLFLFSNIKYRLIISLMLVILNTLHVSFWVIDLQNIKFIYTLSWLLSIFFVFGFLIFKVSKNIKLNKKSTFILFISIPLLYKANFELLDYLAYKVHFKEIIIDYGENKSELNYYDPSKKILNLLEKYNGYKVKVHINRDLLVGSPLDGCMRASPYEILLDKGDNINNFNDIISHLNSDNIMRLKKTINDAYEKNKKMSHSELQSFLMYTKFNDNSFSIHQKTLILIDKMKDKTDIQKNQYCYFFDK